MDDQVRKLPVIDKEGEYNVTLTDPHWVALQPKDGDNNRMALVVTCVTQVTPEWPDGARMDYYINFTRQLIQSGQNKGKAMYKMSQELCLKLGMKTPFDPMRFAELEQVEAVLVAKLEDGKVRPAFLNPVRHVLGAEDVAKRWAAITGGAESSAAPVNVKAGDVRRPQQQPMDDLPFG